LFTSSAKRDDSWTSSGDASLNLLKMVKPGLHLELRLAFQKARRDGRSQRRHHRRTQRGFKTINFEIIPMKNLPGKNRHFMVVFEDIARSAGSPQRARRTTRRISPRKRRES
jgi:two-component system CheB/CheR fusion protein